MAETGEILSAKDAVARAFEIFGDFYSDQKLDNVLLEGLELLEAENLWKVTIAFDSGRAVSDPRSALMGLGAQEVREGRVIFIAADTGSFAKMSKA